MQEANKSLNTADLYDKIAEDYDAHMVSTGHYQAQENLFNKLKPYFKSPVLDLAAGPGFLASILLKNKLKIFLNDFSTTMVQLLKDKFKENPEVVILNQDAHRMHLNEKVKTILCSNLFYYLNDYQKVLENWVPNLDDGGSIILFEEWPFMKSQTGPMSEHEESLSRLVKPLHPDEVKKIFAENKLKLIKEINVSIDDQHDLHGLVFSC